MCDGQQPTVTIQILNDLTARAWLEPWPADGLVTANPGGNLASHGPFYDLILVEPGAQIPEAYFDG